MSGFSMPETALNTPPDTTIYIEDLVAEGAALDEEIKAKRSRLAKIKTELAKFAAFKPGSKTGHIPPAAGYSTKVQLKESRRWDQSGLARVRSVLGDEEFFKLFTYVFKPKSAKEINAFLSHGDPLKVAQVKAAMTVKEGAPQVTFTPLDEGV